MTNSRRSQGELLSRRKRIAAETAGAGGLEIPLRGAGGDLDENVRAWIADLTVANAALRHGIGDSKNKSVSEALERLERLEAALHQAPEQIVEHVGQRTALLASAGMAQMRRIDELEAAESKLASTNERLREENSERERLEREAKEAERGLREVRERFESAYGVNCLFHVHDTGRNRDST